MINMPIQMHINRPPLTQKFFHQHQPRIHIFEICNRPLNLLPINRRTPSICISELLQDCRFTIDIRSRQFFAVRDVHLADFDAGFRVFHQQDAVLGHGAGLKFRNVRVLDLSKAPKGKKK